MKAPTPLSQKSMLSNAAVEGFALITKGKNALEAALGEAQDSEAKNQIKRIRKWLTVIGVSTLHPLTFLVVGVYVII